jgi:tetratricopeptide (TPR) repeat protein
MRVPWTFRVPWRWRRTPSTVDIFRRVQHHREEGRFEEAAELVAYGLGLEPDSIVGRLLAAYLHVVFREMASAKADFERVLARDPTHPRALLGLARIALEEGDAGSCAALLRRALERYPEFPEAAALLDVVEGGPAPRPAGTPAVTLERLPVPRDAREVIVTRPDGAVVFARVRGPRSGELAVHTARVARLAGALLARAGLGPARGATIEGATESTLLRWDDALLLSVAFGADLEPATAAGQLERLWETCADATGRRAS